MAGQNGHSSAFRTMPATPHHTHKTDILHKGNVYMPTPQYEPNVPMPYTTKKAGKRTKHPFGRKAAGMGRTTEIGLIYADNTNAQVADNATERRLSVYGPPTSTRMAGYNVLWGETDIPPKECCNVPNQHNPHNPHKCT